MLHRKPVVAYQPKESVFDALAAACKTLSMLGRRYEANDLTRRVFQLDPKDTVEAFQIIQEYVELRSE